MNYFKIMINVISFLHMRRAAVIHIVVIKWSVTHAIGKLRITLHFLNVANENVHMYASKIEATIARYLLG